MFPCGFAKPYSTKANSLSFSVFILYNRHTTRCDMGNLTILKPHFVHIFVNECKYVTGEAKANDFGCQTESL